MQSPSFHFRKRLAKKIDFAGNIEEVVEEKASTRRSICSCVPTLYPQETCNMATKRRLERPGQDWKGAISKGSSSSTSTNITEEETIISLTGDDDDHSTTSTVVEFHSAEEEDIVAYDHERTSSRGRCHHRYDLRFDLSKNQVYQSELREGLTQNDISNGWYSKEELHNIMSNARHDIMEFRKGQSSSINSNEKLSDRDMLLQEFNHLISKSKKVSREYDDYLPLIFNDEKAAAATTTSIHEFLQHTSLLLLDGGLRGLEMDVIPLLGTLRQRHVKNVVEHCKRIPKSIVNIDLKQRMIYQKSIQTSRPLRIISQILGKKIDSDTTTSY